jgi:hypothetical protein
LLSSDKASNSSSLLPQNASAASVAQSLLDEYSYVIGPTTNKCQMTIVLSDDAPNFYIDRTFFAETTAYVVDQFYSVIGREAYDVQTEIEVLEVKQVGATLNVMITYGQTTLYRSRFRAGGKEFDEQVENIVQGPFIAEEGKSFCP